MTPVQILQIVRSRAQDALFLRGPDKYVGETLFSFLNQTISNMVMLRPDIFTQVIDNWQPDPGKVLQELTGGTPSLASFRFVEAFSAKKGQEEVVLEEVDYDHFGRASRDWIKDTADLPVKFMRHPRNANRFFLYPKPDSGVELTLEYVKIPTKYDDSNKTDDITDMSASYYPVLVEGILYHIYTVENSDNSSQIGISRAGTHLNNFNQGLGLSLQARTITDTDMMPMPVEDQRR